MDFPVYHSLDSITKLLDNYFKSINSSNNTYVTLDRIKNIGNSRVVVSLYKVEEEPILKNATLPPIIREGKIVHKNQPVILNLYVLFVAMNDEGDYSGALKDISIIIEFFQIHNKFDASNTLDPNFDFELRHQLISPSNEDVNHIWSSLEGSLRPFLMYKFCLVPIDVKKLKGLDLPIESINLITKDNN